jgi:hypothetical protein
MGIRGLWRGTVARWNGLFGSPRGSRHGRADGAWHGSERGMVSAEYAVGIIAAVAFALLLLSVMQSDAVRAALVGIVSNALSVRG